MKCFYELPMPWALILALILSFAVTTARLPKELSLISTASLTACLMAASKVAHCKAVISPPRWKQLFQIHSPDDGVPLIAVCCFESNYGYEAGRKGRLYFV